MNSQLLHVIEQRAERLPEILDIGEQHRLPVAAELHPGHLLDDLLQRADAAGQRDEGVRHLEHLAFALVHVAGDDQVVLAAPRVLARHQEFGDDAGDLRRRASEHRVGELAHHADGAAAIDEADAVLGQDRAEGAWRLPR